MLVLSSVQSMAATDSAFAFGWVGVTSEAVTMVRAMTDASLAELLQPLPPPIECPIHQERRFAPDWASGAPSRPPVWKLSSTSMLVGSPRKWCVGVSWDDASSN